MKENTIKVSALALALTMAFSCNPSKTKAVEMETEQPSNTYTIKKGDTLREISFWKYGNSKYYKEIAIINNIKDSNKIYVKDELYLPETLDELLNMCYREDEDKVLTYIVQKGDTLSEICKEFYKENYSRLLTMKLATYNKLYDPNIIVTGSVINLPPYETLKNVKAIDYVEVIPICPNKHHHKHHMRKLIP